MAKEKNAAMKCSKVKNASLKVKKTMKTGIAPSPRLRLEPRLNSSPSKKAKNDQDYAHLNETKSHSNEHGIETDSFHESFYEESSTIISRNEEQNKVSDAKSLLTQNETNNYKTGGPEKSKRKSNEIETNCFQKLRESRTTKSNKCVLQGQWTDTEWLNLAAGLQAHGFSDLKKIADLVATKSENDIREYIKLGRQWMMYDPDPNRWNRHGNTWNTHRPEYLATWPNIRKWRRFAYEQMLVYTKSKEYSKPIISALFKKFYEEEKEPSDSQVINIKLIYKYMMDCMSGDIPPQLPPKESAIVLDLLQEVRLIPNALDFEEERKFLQEFRSATKFKPFQVKDEFKNQGHKVSDDDNSSFNTVAVPEELFLHLSRHKRLVQSFSPLVTPVWMLQKEQEFLQK